MTGLPWRSNQGLLSTRPATGASPAGGATPVQVQRGDQAASGVRHDRDRSSRVLGRDQVERAVQLRVVMLEVGGEVRGLAGAPGPAGLAQVEGVESQAAGGAEVGQLGLEEVVGEPVDVEHRAVDGLLRGGRTTDHDRDHLALAVGVGAELEDVLLVAVAEEVGLPGRGLRVGHGGGHEQTLPEACGGCVRDVPR